MTVVNVTKVPYNVTSVELDNMTASPLPAAASGRSDLWYWRVALYAVGGIGVECIGIVCNIIAIIVLAHFKKRSSAPFLLICLAIVDSIYLLSLLFLENIRLLESGSLIRKSYRASILPVYSLFYPVPFVSQTCVTYLVVIITLERYVVIRWPFIAHRICSAKSAKIGVAVVLISSILFHTPLYMAFRCDNQWKNDSRSHKNTFHRTEFGRTAMFKVVYGKWLNLIFNFCLPFLLLFVFNGLLIKTLMRRKKAEITAQNRIQREVRLTVMVICMTVVFLVCELTVAVSLSLTFRINDYHLASRDINRFTAMGDFLMLVNSAINFCVYCATGRKFRETFCELFCRCGRPRGSKFQAHNKSSNCKQLKRDTFQLTEYATSLRSIFNRTHTSQVHATNADGIHAKLMKY